MCDKKQKDVKKDVIKKIDIKSMSEEMLREYIQSLGEPKFRAKQIFTWLHKHLVSDFDAMTNLSLGLRERLKSECVITSLKQVEVRTSKIDATKKYLFQLPDGNIIESVWMKYEHGNSVCVSCQVGCRMGCTFCASTIDGLLRNLRAAEILEQVYLIQKLSGERVSNIVCMGAGEPMDNLDNVLQFIRTISSENGLHISQRNITVSTCGIVPKMRALAEEGLQITLALSLHAPKDEIRQKLMPIAKSYSIKEVLDACDYYFQKTGRRVSFEYSLVKGENDNLEEAKALCALIRGRNAHVNLIPVNPIKERDYQQSTPRAVLTFKEYLQKHRINVTIRREMGRDIDGACGQLRRHFLEENIQE